jgi:hypothetical protein
LKGKTVLSINDYLLLDVDKFYGIEYEEFPAQIAQVAMWLIDHQMNLVASETFGSYYIRLPLKKSATIAHANALRIDWQSLLQPQLSDVWAKTDLDNLKYDFIMGNPPFLGTAYQNSEQKSDLSNIFKDVKANGMLDYVSCWYAIASRYIKENDGLAGFVSTNSIIQGEQATILWSYLFGVEKVKIKFAYRTFKWNNEAKANAAVHCVIIGFSHKRVEEPTLFDFDNSDNFIISKAKNINQYLIDAPNVLIQPRTNPLCNVSRIGVGSALLDGGLLILNDDQKIEVLKQEPQLAKFIKKLYSAEEFINNKIRWCFWLKNISPNEIQGSNLLKERLKQIKEFRNKSSRSKTNEMAEKPFLFGEERQPSSKFLLIPKVSSINRKYVPIGFMNEDDIITDKVFASPNATMYEFGVITSIMHMIWLKFVGGRLKSDYSYSNTIVYNNFPWPENPTKKQKQSIESCAKQILDVRSKYENQSLANLYYSLSMPSELIKAHNELDKAVDAAYRSQPLLWIKYSRAY